MSVLHDGCEHCAELWTVGFCVGAEDTKLVLGAPTDCLCRAAAHFPAWLHLWAVSER